MIEIIEMTCYLEGSGPQYCETVEVNEQVTIISDDELKNYGTEYISGTLIRRGEWFSFECRQYSRNPGENGADSTFRASVIPEEYESNDDREALAEKTEETAGRTEKMYLRTLEEEYRLDLIEEIILCSDIDREKLEDRSIAELEKVHTRCLFTSDSREEESHG